jgi:hypothetical protein
MSGPNEVIAKNCASTRPQQIGAVKFTVQCRPRGEASQAHFKRPAATTQFSAIGWMAPAPDTLRRPIAFASAP